MHKLHNGSFRPKSRIAPPLGLMQLTRFNRKVVLLYTCKLYKGKPGNQCLALDTLHTYVNIPGHKKRFLKINSRNSFSPASFKESQLGCPDAAPAVTPRQDGEGKPAVFLYFPPPLQSLASKSFATVTHVTTFAAVLCDRHA